MKKLIFILIAITLLNACGIKGQLYLPEKRYPQPTQDNK